MGCAVNVRTMQIDEREIPAEVHEDARTRITSDLIEALQSVTTVGERFVVNDTIWYGPSRRTMNPRVVNTADFISKKVEGFLEEHRGWKSQKKIEGQVIDAYIEVETPSGFSIPRSDLFTFLDAYTDSHTDEELDTVAVRIFQMYVKRQCFTVDSIPEELHGHFKECEGTETLRVGFEFETGNIASSFRAINKLGFLYRRGHIDAGVFVTSCDKNSAAARIWPITNRNGSFEELERRQYSDAIFYPVWEFGFAPDQFDQNANYLGRDQTYILVNTGDVETFFGEEYERWEGGGNTVYKPV